MSPHPGLRIIGSFGLKLSPNGFAISLTRSNHRPINARSARSSKRNEVNGERYLHGPGTGITNLPSFSATKFSELLEELPFASLFSTLMTSFFVGFRFRQTLPVGPSIGVVAFLTSS